MPGGIRENHEFEGNTGQRVEPVSESYSGGGQIRDLFSIFRKLSFLGCLLPLLCSLTCALGGFAVLGYDWIVYTLENGWDSEIAGWGIGLGIVALVTATIVIIPLVGWVRRKLTQMRQ